MTKIDRHTKMPGWVSHGPVQVNGNIFAGAAHTQLEAARSIGSSDAPVGRVALKCGLLMLGVLAAVAIGIPVALLVIACALLLGAFAVAIWLGFMGAIVTVWLTCRAAELALLVERKVAGRQGRLMYVPSVFRNDYVQVLESDYDHDSIDTEAHTAAPVLAKRAR